MQILLYVLVGFLAAWSLYQIYKGKNFIFASILGAATAFASDITIKGFQLPEFIHWGLVFSIALLAIITFKNIKSQLYTKGSVHEEV